MLTAKCIKYNYIYYRFVIMKLQLKTSIIKHKPYNHMVTWS